MNPTSKSLFRRLLRGLGALAVSAFIAAPATAAGEPSYHSWFKPHPDLHQSWTFQAHDGDPKRVTVSHLIAPEGAKKKILVFFPRPSSAYDIAMSKILSVFEEKRINAEFTLYNFHKDSALGQKGLRLAHAGKFDLIFSMGSESTAWLWTHYRNGKIPVVSVCSKDPVILKQTPSYDVGTGTNFAFTSLNMPVEVQMAYILELKPYLKNLAILVNSGNVSAVKTQARPIAESARARGIRVVNLAIKDARKARGELSALVPDAVALMRKNDPGLNNSLFLITGSTAVFREITTINAHSDRIPVLSVVPEVVKAGDDSAVLSIGISFESNAHLAAIYGASVLDGSAKPGNLPVGIVSPPDIAINFRKAREIALYVPFSFFESASFIYDYDGRIVRNNGKAVSAASQTQ